MRTGIRAGDLVVVGVTEADSNVSGAAADCPNAEIEINANRLAVATSGMVFMQP